MEPRMHGFSRISHGCTDGATDERMSHGCTDLWVGGEEFFYLEIEI